MPDEYGNSNAALAAATSQAINQANSYMAATNLNKKSRDFSREMYEKTKADALANWDRQNEYNSPSSQMERLRVAGLNPNLVYGNGSQVSAASTPETGKALAWNPTNPTANMGKSPIEAYQDVQVRQAQLDNLKAQNTLIHNQAVSTMADAILKGVNTDSASFNLDYKMANRELMENQLQANYDKTNIDISQKSHAIDVMLDQNERAAAMQAVNIQTAMEKILTIRAEREGLLPEQIKALQQQIQNMAKDGTIKNFELALNEANTSKGDPLWFRMLNQMMTKLFGKAPYSK